MLFRSCGLIGTGCDQGAHRQKQGNDANNSQVQTVTVDQKMKYDVTKSSEVDKSCQKQDKVVKQTSKKSDMTKSKKSKKSGGDKEKSDQQKVDGIKPKVLLSSHQPEGLSKKA